MTIALCAARSEPMPDDLYLSDAVHHALLTKFVLDWHSEGILPDIQLADLAVLKEMMNLRDVEIILSEEMRNQIKLRIAAVESTILLSNNVYRDLFLSHLDTKREPSQPLIDAVKLHEEFVVEE